MSRPRRPQTPPSIPWPTNEQLQRLGFIRCPGDGCKVYLDPVNVPNGRCREHGRAANRNFSHKPRIRESQ